MHADDAIREAAFQRETSFGAFTATDAPGGRRFRRAANLSRRDRVISDGGAIRATRLFSPGRRLLAQRLYSMGAHASLRAARRHYCHGRRASDE